MADRRKLQAEIDRCHKKVQEGVEVFEDIWQKAHNAPNINQKEKYEGDLKKEIKKLQRLRDQIKTWIASSDIKDKRVLVDDRKLIETQMERFKILERETKTKAYSKEGLGAAQKLDPAQREKEDLCNWITNSIESLNIQIDQFESEIETIGLQLRKKKNDKDKQERIEKLKSFVDKHKYHISQLETVMRMLDNSTIDVNQVKSIKDDVDYYIDSSQDPDFEENEFIYEDLELEDINEFLNKSKMNLTNNNSTANSQQNPSTNNDEEGTNSIQSTAHTSPSISPSPSPGLLNNSTISSKQLDEQQQQNQQQIEVNSLQQQHDKLGMSNHHVNNLPSSLDNKDRSDYLVKSLNSSTSFLSNNSASQPLKSNSSVWSHSNTSTNNTTSVSSSTQSLNTTTTPNNLNNSFSITTIENELSTDSSIIPSTNSNSTNNEQAQENISSSENFIKSSNSNLKAASNLNSLYNQTSNQLNSLLDSQNKSLKNSSLNPQQTQQPGINGPSSLPQKPQKCTSPPHNQDNNQTSRSIDSTNTILNPQFTSPPQISPQQLANVSADLYQAVANANSSSSNSSSAWNNLNSIVNSRSSNNNQSNNGQQTVKSLNAQTDVEQQKLTSLKSMAQLAVDSARIDHNNQSLLSNSQPDNEQTTSSNNNLQHLQQLKTQQSNPNYDQVSNNSSSTSNQSTTTNANSIMSLLSSGGNLASTGNNQAVKNLVLQQQTSVQQQQQQQQSKIQQQQQQLQQTTEAHISPMLGVAPLGSITLTKPMIYQMHMLEAASRHLIHPMDSQRTRGFLSPNAFPTPSYYPQQALPKSDTLEFFDRLSTETLFFVFYFMEGTKAQFLAAKTLKKQSWRFHTKFMMWFQRHEEPKAITDEYEQGTYIYFDYEKWGQRKKEHFTFEYRYLEDRDLN